MRVSLKRLCVYLILFFYLVENHFYYLVKMNNTAVKYILFAICILVYACIFVCVNRKEQYYHIKRTSLFLCFGIIPLFLIVQFLYTKITYEQGVIDFLKASYHYFFIVLTIPIYYIFVKDNSVTFLMDKLTKIVSIGLLLNIINSLLYNTTGVTFLQSAIKLRDDSLRTYSLSSILGIITVYTAWRLICFSHAKRKYVINFVIEIVALVYCYQSRIIEFCVFAVVIYMLVAEKSLTKKQIVIIGGIILGILILFYSGMIMDFVDSFKIGGQYSGSSSSRIRECKYYISGFLENKFFGLGLLATESEIGNYVIRGPLGNNYPTDVGYVGALGNMGISFFLPFGFLIYRICAVIRKSRQIKTKDFEVKSLIVLCKSLLIYILMSGASQIITDPARILGVPFVISIVDWADFLIVTRRRNE